MLQGGTGDDNLQGGLGADLFRFVDNFGTDTVIGAESGADEDIIDTSALSAGATVTYTTSGEFGTTTQSADEINFGQVETLILTGFDDVITTAGSYGISLQTGAGADSISV